MDLPKASVVSAPRGIWDLLLTDADHKSSPKSAAIHHNSVESYLQAPTVKLHFYLPSISSLRARWLSEA